MFDKLQTFGLLRDINIETGRVTAVISTGDVARDDAIIDPAGWDFANYDLNPVVLFQHNADAVPFARTVEHGVAGDNLIATAEFDLEDPVGAAMFRKVSRGYINATSVRWLPKRWEYRKMGSGDQTREVLVFLEQELLEWSLVTIPADPKALIVRADGQPFDRTAFTLPETISLPPASGDEAGDDVSPPPSPVRVAFEAATARMASYIEHRAERPTIDDLIIRSLAHQTGRSEEQVRRQLAGIGASNA